MPTRCEQSRLVIPNDLGYAPLVGRYAADLATRYEFTARQTDAIASAVTEAVESLLTYSFEPAESGQINIEFERIAEGLQIRLRDKGLPFGSKHSEGQTKAEDVGIQPDKLQDRLDRVYLKNRGREGKEVVLVKYLHSKSVQDYFDACMLEPFARAPEEEGCPRAPGPCMVRQLLPDEAPEVSKIIYKTYGYQYSTDYVYYPDKIAAMNADGRIYSAVAIADDGRLVGHCALQFSTTTPQIAEMGQGAVVPGDRGKGCFKNLTGHLVTVARERSVAGIYSRAVTTHTHSQHTALQSGFKQCGLMLGLIPAGTEFRGFAKPSGRRGAMFLQFLDLGVPEPRKVWLPERHHQMTARIYNKLGHLPEVTGTGNDRVSASAGHSRYDVEIHPGLSYAAIRLIHAGRKVVDDLQSELKKMILRKTEIIHLKLALNDRQTAWIASEMERAGFFFAGILPAGLPNSDALILQYLNGVPVDYGKIKAASDIGKDLVAYIKELDPNRQIH